MQISIDKAIDGFVAFMADQVASIPKDIERWKGFAVLGVIKCKPRAAIDALKPLAEKIGLIHDDKIDVDVMKSALEMAFSRVPEVEFFNFKFNAEDVKALMDKLSVVVSEPVSTEVQA